MTLYDRREALHQARLVEHSTAYSPPFQQALDALRAQGMSQQQGAEAILDQLVRQAYLLSATDIFWLSSVLALAMLGLIWLTRRPSGDSEGPPVAAE